MSKHNDIYSILGKLESLQPKEQPVKAEDKKPIYESVEARGSVLEGVAKVEQQLAEKYMGFKKTVAAVKKGGSAENPEAVAAAIGRKKYGKTKFQKAAAAGKKLGEGDVEEGNEFSGNLEKARAQGKKEFEVDGKTYPVKESGLQAYLGKKKYGKEGMKPKGSSGKVAGKRYGGSAQKDDEGDKEEATADAPKKRGRPKKDKFSEVAPPGAKAERMVKHIKKSYADGGKLTPKEKSIAYATAWKAHNKGKLAEGVNFAEMMREAHANAEELLTELQMEISEFKKSGRMGDKLRDVLELHKFSKRPVVDEVVAPEAVNPAIGRDAVSPAEKLAPHAGVGKGPIGKAIGAATTMGKNIGRFIQGKPEIPTLEDQELNELAKLAGLAESKSKPDYIDLDKDGNKKESMKDAAKDAKLDECGDMSPMSAMGQDQGNLSINTSMNSDGTKSVSVNATGDQADMLAQLLKMAGIGGTAQPQETSEESVEEERTAQYANTPDEEVETVDAIIHQGNDLNREKEQYADRPKAGDNPMATPVRESVEMPKKVSRMLEGIKKVI